MKFYSLLYTLLFGSLLFVTACQPENDKNPALFGKWRGKEWLIFDRPSGQDATQVFLNLKQTALMQPDLENKAKKAYGARLETNFTLRQKAAKK